jgi:large subunit ribosomal protein L15
MVEKKKKTTKPAAPKAGGKPAAKAAAPKKTAPKTPKAAAAPAKTPQAPAAARPPRPQRKVAASDTPARPAATGVHDLAPAAGATHYRKRVGRGPGSGHGKTAGRGNKGQKSRSGYRHMRGFEGGQMPLHRRVPKRGFTNIFRVEYDIVNLGDLDRFDAGASVTPQSLADARLTRKSRPVKILGDGELKKALTVSAHKFSASAKARIEAAGGRCEVLSR